MKVVQAYRRILALALVTLWLLPAPLAGQQRRTQQPSAAQRRRTPSRRAARQTSAPASSNRTAAPSTHATSQPSTQTWTTRPLSSAAQKDAEADLSFETIVPAATYSLYGELRNVGQQLSSGETLRMLEMTSSLTGTAFELRDTLDFLRTHAETLNGARLMFAGMASNPSIPQAFFAVEFPSVEAAEKFTPEFYEFIYRTAPPELEIVAEGGGAATPARRRSEPAPAPKKEAQRTRTARLEHSGTEAPKPSPFFLKRVGRLIFATDARLDLKSLTAAQQGNASKLLFNQPNFRRARSRFASESLFIYFDIGTMQRHFEEMQKEMAAQEAIRVASAPKLDAQGSPAEAALPPLSAETAPLTSDGEEMVELVTPVPMKTPEAVAAQPEGARTEEEAEAGATLTPEEMVRERALKTGMSEQAVEEEMLASTALPSLFGGLLRAFAGSSAGSEWQTPEALGLGATFEGDELALRLLLVNGEGVTQASLIPFFPLIIAGAPMTPEAASYAPAETDVFVTTSLDLLQIYDRFVEQTKQQHAMNMRALEAEARISRHTIEEGVEKQAAPAATPQAPAAMTEAPATEAEAVPSLLKQLALLEKLLNIRIREDLIGSLGHEVAFCMPGSYLKPPPTMTADEPAATADQPIRQPSAAAAATPAGSPTPEQAAKPRPPALQSPVILISLKNRQALETLLPRLLPLLMLGMGSEQSRVKSGDTEINSLGGVAFALVGNTLALSPDAISLRRVAEAYQAGQTLSGVESFRRATQWQPRQTLGQIFVSNEMVKDLLGSEKREAEEFADAESRSFLTQFNYEPGAATHAVTNEGEGLLHEVRLSRNLVNMFMAYASVSSKHASVAAGERQAISTLQMLHSAELEYKEMKGTGKETVGAGKEKKGGGKFGTLEELKNARLMSSDMFEMEAYRIDLNVTGDKFEATATPLIYPERGRRSFFIDESGVLRGADKAGARANASDPPLK